MRILVTGANGFVGRYLVEELENRGHDVLAGHRRRSFDMDFHGKPVLLDVADYDACRRVLDVYKPQCVIHLAAQTMIGESWNDPRTTFQINTLGTVNLIHCSTTGKVNPRVITVGSGEEYGFTALNVSELSEDDPCRPSSPYALSKFAAGQYCVNTGDRLRVNFVHVRPFNHFGPGQRKGFVVSDFAWQIASIERRGADPVINVGNLETERDFMNVRDVVAGYADIAESESVKGVVNICSGRATPIRWLLEKLLSYSDKKIEIQIDPTKLRPVEIPRLVGNPSKAIRDVGWKPSRMLAVSLLDTLNWWRHEISGMK